MAEANEQTQKVVPLKPIEKPSPKLAAEKPAKKKVVAKKSVRKQTVKKTAAKKKPTAQQKAKPKAKLTTSKSVQTNKTATNPMETIMTQNKAQFEQFTKDAADLNREGVDAFVKSGQIFAKGFEAIIRESLAVAQASAEKQASFVTEALNVKTVNEFSEVQNKIAQTNFDDFMASATKLTELSTKVLTEAVEPINNQVTKSVQKASDAVAAE